MCKERICACMVLYASFPFICYATLPCSEKVEFRPIDPTPSAWEGVGVEGDLRAKYLLPCCCIQDSLKFDKQHDHVLIK